MDSAGLGDRAPTPEDISFRIAPRLNAPGRMGAPDLSFLLMREKDPEKARSLADQVEHLQNQRRADQNSRVPSDRDGRPARTRSGR